ncbi:aldolase [Saccharata proteae CBS 121410]|uniref:Fructose-bisphosphate aldolase n=1 Tax=Saccharata proteae CBS 121410 TaxID=1314787 RepID=A0A9P4HXP1_9PEZI|nr:aldolase [Saccharata proteae CBS 121410]
MLSHVKTNKTVRILEDAERRGYGVVAAIAYNIEHVIAFVRAAEQKRDGLLVRAAAEAASRATVPIAIHLDHAQDEAMIRRAVDELPFDSIMVDMSHHEKADNIAKTKELVAYCHEGGIATEAEPGRIEGGEDGIADTVELSGLLTTPEEAEEFIDTGVDFLAPAFGNIHGEYGARGPQLDFARLDSIRKSASGRVRMVLHGTNSFNEETMRDCIAHGISKVNVNKLVLEDYLAHLKRTAASSSLTQLMEEGVEKVIKLVEWQMEVCKSTGKA